MRLPRPEAMPNALCKYGVVAGAWAGVDRLVPCVQVRHGYHCSGRYADPNVDSEIPRGNVLATSASFASPHMPRTAS